MTFQRAPPEVNGLGVITSTPGLIRSSQVLMFFGLPLRTTSTTTESVTMPLYWSWFQFGDDQAGLDQPGHVGLEREGDDVGGQAGGDRAALVARGAVGLVKLHALAGGGLLEGRDQLPGRPPAASSRRPATSLPAAAAEPTRTAAAGQQRWRSPRAREAAQGRPCFGILNPPGSRSGLTGIDLRKVARGQSTRRGIPAARGARSAENRRHAQWMTPSDSAPAVPVGVVMGISISSASSQVAKAADEPTTASRVRSPARATGSGTCTSRRRRPSERSTSLHDLLVREGLGAGELHGLVARAPVQRRHHAGRGVVGPDRLVERLADRRTRAPRAGRTGARAACSQ